ncbi:MAG TPA: beta-ketoacyl synthase N-terminal-like domain-containing protein, partial [Fibrobacteria bacterium]|nr:beta-ketoacyl synthase N-terminal-like domain-containing protein [Fibrobacteria bacterium]
MRAKDEKRMKSDDIAVIGMAGRWPGAEDVGRFWENLRAGRECISEFTDAELRAAGVPETDLRDGAYVKASPVIADIDKFDAAFFKIPPVEAEMTDPQIRLLLQCAWETLEDAGYAG